MPLARIVTRLAEDTDSLAQDLRARGFEVVTKSPDEISSEPADLEITVDECASEEALTSASGIARAQDKCVFIAPGAITENLRAVRVMSPPVMMRESVPKLTYDSIEPAASDELEPLAAIRQLQEHSETQEQIPLPEATEAVVVDRSAAVAEPQVTDFALESVSDPQLAAPLAEELAEPEVAETSAAEEEVVEEELVEEQELVAHEYLTVVDYLPTPISEPVLESPLAAPEIEPREYSQTQPEVISDMQPEALVEIPATFQQEEVFLVETEATLDALPETMVAIPEVVEVEPVSLTEPEAISEMQPQAVMEAAAILQADVSLTETEPISDWPIWHPLAEAESHAQDSPLPESLVKKPTPDLPLTSRAKTVFEEPIPQVVPLMRNAVTVRANTYRQRILQKRVVQNDEVFWKTATVLAMVAVAALLVGASANRFSPLPANLVQRSVEAQQPVPFEKARIVPALPLDAGNKIDATELSPAHGSDVARFHPALAVEPAAPRIVPEAADRSNDRLVRAKPRRPSAGQPGSDMVAEDTVVRYDKKHPPASHTQAQKNSGVKQYSDLD